MPRDKRRGLKRAFSIFKRAYTDSAIAINCVPSPPPEPAKEQLPMQKETTLLLPDAPLTPPPLDPWFKAIQHWRQVEASV